MIETIKSLESQRAACDNFEVQQQDKLAETEFQPSGSNGISLKRVFQ